MAEDVAELVGRYLADERALRTERAHPGKRVRRRSAGDFLGRAHRVVKAACAVLIDQRHPALVEAELVDQLLFTGGHHINDGVADGDYVVAGVGHGYSGRRAVGASGAVSGSSRKGQGWR